MTIEINGVLFEAGEFAAKFRDTHIAVNGVGGVVKDLVARNHFSFYESLDGGFYSKKPINIDVTKNKIQIIPEEGYFFLSVLNRPVSSGWLNLVPLRQHHEGMTMNRFEISQRNDSLNILNMPFILPQIPKNMAELYAAFAQKFPTIEEIYEAFQFFDMSAAPLSKSILIKKSGEVCYLSNHYIVGKCEQGNIVIDKNVTCYEEIMEEISNEINHLLK